MEDLRLMRAHTNPNIQIKAAGGLRTLDEGGGSISGRMLPLRRYRNGDGSGRLEGAPEAGGRSPAEYLTGSEGHAAPAALILELSAERGLRRVPLPRSR